MIKDKKTCKTCKESPTSPGNGVARGWGYCDDCYGKLTNGPEMHAEDYKKMSRRKPQYEYLVEVE